jgi:hypothetical protein
MPSLRLVPRLRLTRSLLLVPRPRLMRSQRLARPQPNMPSLLLVLRL